MVDSVLGLGLVGAGEFGRFCLGAYTKLPDLKLVAVCDSEPERLANLAETFGMAAYSDYAAMLADDRVNIVAVSTPPASHASLSIAAARANKHVFCEKPLATSLADTEAVLWAAQEAGIALTVDYVMRQNPLYRLLKQLSDLRSNGGPVLGELRRCSLENFAIDEGLPPDHWFWNESVSGGIFVEHGVHFFDLFDWQLGRRPERVVAMLNRREGGAIDTVQAVVGYEGQATSSCYHAFARAKAAEHQSLVFGWDWATAELHGWIPLDLTLDAFVDDESLAALTALLEPGGELLVVPQEKLLPSAILDTQVIERFPGGRVMSARGEERRIGAHVRLSATLGMDEVKMLVYEQCVRAGMADLLAAARFRQNRTGLSPTDMWLSTAVAIAAREAAASGREVALARMPSWLASSSPH